MAEQFIEQIKIILPESVWPQVIRALRHDLVIWGSLEDKKFAYNAIDYAKVDPEKWSPASLAFLSLSISNIFSQISTSPKENLPEDIRTQAASQLEDFLNLTPPNNNLTLAQAGLIAIAFREQWRVTGVWNELVINLISQPELQWHPVLACLYGMLPDPETLIEVLISNDNPPFTQNLGLHALLSNPLTILETAKTIIQYLSNFSSHNKIKFIRYIQAQHPELAKFIADEILNTLLEHPENSSNPMEQIQNLLERTELLKISGRHAQAIPLLESAWEHAQHIQAEMTTQLAQAAADNQDHKTAKLALEQASRLNYQSSEFESQITLAKISSGEIDLDEMNIESINDLEPENIFPNLIAAAILAAQIDQSQKAITYADQALQLAINDQPPTYSPENLLSLAELFYSLKVPLKTQRTIELLLSVSPNNAKALVILSNSQIASGDTLGGLTTAHTAASLSPNKIDIRRHLAQAMITNQQYVQALEELEKLIQRQTTPSPEDLLLLASCALQAGVPHKTAKACQQVLHSQPTNHEAHTLYGQAMLQTGDQQTAIDHFTQAATIAPQFPEAWLELTHIHLEKGDIKKAKEQLMAAVQSVDGHPEIHLALGKIYLGENTPTKALTEFQKSARSIENDPIEDLSLINQIQLNLGKTYFLLGYLDEANQILSEAHQSNPINPAIAHIYAKVLMATDKSGAALSALTIAMQTEPVDPDVYLDYAQIHIDLGSHPEEANRVLQNILENDITNAKAILLQAETHTLLGNPIEALNTFQIAMGTDLAHDPIGRCRIVIGLADAAITLNQADLAISVLKDALQNDSNNFDLLKTLCNAYAGSDQPKEALNTLIAIRTLGENNPDVLLWVAEIASSIGEDKLALDVLNRASQIDPNNVDILINLGFSQITQNKTDKARKTFARLFKSKSANSGSLRLAAQAFIGLGEVENSIPFLERALEISSEEETLMLMNDMAAAHTQAGNYEAALSVIEKQVSLKPYDPDLHDAKANLLIELDRPKAAILAVLAAVNLTPENANLHIKAAQLLKENGDLTAGLAHAEKAIELSPQDPVVQYLAIDLNLACLHTKRANHLIEQSNTLGQDLDFSLLLLHAELMISKNNLSEAQSYLEKYKDTHREHPHFIALEAQILYLQNDQTTAETIFKKGLAKLGALDNSRLAPHNTMKMQLALAETAIKFHHWDVALYLGKEASKTVPFDPRPHFFLANTYIAQAEFQRLCMAVQAQQNTPGPIAISEDATKLFQQAIQSVQRIISIDIDHPLIQNLIYRSHYLFDDISPEEEVEKLLRTPEETAAVMAAYRRSGNKSLALQIGENFPKHPQILIETALTLSTHDLDRAIEFTYAAIEQQSNNPISLALLATLSKESGDFQTAGEAINRALGLWVDEPHWHALAADIQNRLSHNAIAIIHLEQACHIEPQNVEHFIQLARIHLDDNDSPKAIGILERAAHIAPESPEVWENLAIAYQTNQNIQQALHSAGQMLTQMPDHPKPLLLHADLHLANNNPMAAQPYVEQALSLEPTNPAILEKNALVLMRLNRSKEALTTIDIAISKTENPLDYLITRANLIGIIEGEHSKLKTLTALAQKFPEEAQPLAALAAALVEAKQPDEAMRATQQAIKVGEGFFPPLDQAKLHLQLGQLLRQGGQLDQAIHHIDQAIQLSPSLLEAYIEIGEAYTDRRDYQLALENFKHGITIAPNDTRAYHKAGLLLKECKDYTGAEEMLRRASSLSPKNVDIQRQLAAIVALALVHTHRPLEVNA